MISRAPRRREPRWGRPEPSWRVLRPPVAAATHAFFALHTVGLHHIPRTGPCLVVANHVDHLDPIAILIALLERRGRHPRFLALDDLFDKPLTGRWLRVARAIPVTRGAGVESMLAPARRALAAGELVVVYPEGRLPRAGEPRATARRGAGALAQGAEGVPIVPLAHWGLQTADPLSRHPARTLLQRGLRAPVGLVAGPPLSASDLATGDAAAVSAALLGIIRAQLEPRAARLVAAVAAQR